MNANTALKINDAIDQAVRCGESVAEIQAQVARALVQARRVKAAEDFRRETAATQAMVADLERDGLL